MDIKNKALNFSTYTVNSSNDYEELLKWKNDLTLHLIEIKRQIEEYKINQSENDRESNRSSYWFVRVNKYKRMQSVLLQQIAARMTIVKKHKHNLKMERERNFWRSKCRDLITEEDFGRYCHEIESQENPLAFLSKT